MQTKQPKRQMLPIKRVIPNPRNDNQHARSQIEMLTESVKHFGQPRPILVRQANHMIIAGHGVWQAMIEAGEPEIDVLLWDVDQPTADAYLLADNRFHELSSPDMDRRAELLSEIPPEDFAALGFLPAEVEAMLDGGESLAVEEIATGDVLDRFWVGISGPLVHQAQALRRIREVMAEIPEIQVDIGVTTGFG
jgi:ParB-like chromosome segregation protein Spo0J